MLFPENITKTIKLFFVEEKTIMQLTKKHHLQNNFYSHSDVHRLKNYPAKFENLIAM